MLAPFIIDELERERRREGWKPVPLYIEAPPVSPVIESEPEELPPNPNLIIIDFGGDGQ